MISIDARSSKPIYEQIVDGIKENIMKGILVPRQKLPSVREMSRMLTANPNTISKAYLELERQKVIETITGRGTFVSGRYTPKADEDRVRRIQKTLRGLIIEAHYLGLDEKNVNEMVYEIYREIERK